MANTSQEEMILRELKAAGTMGLHPSSSSNTTAQSTTYAKAWAVSARTAFTAWQTSTSSTENCRMARLSFFMNTPGRIGNP